MTGPEARVDAEREFLFRSLDDLEAEHDSGNIDDATYERLHSDYTARAAASLRSGDPDVATPVTVTPPISAARRAASIGGIIVFGLVAAIVLATALGGRMPGQTSSGNTATVSQADRRRTLEQAVRETPDDVQARLALARFLMARQKYPDAFEQFSAVTGLDPANVEAQAYSGWLLYLAGQIDEAIVRIDAALAADETYPDAHFFKGLVLFRGKSDATGAIPEFQRYITLVPDSPLSAQVRGLLAEAVADTKPPATP